MELYSISLSSPDRSISWCDDLWYETQKGQTFSFTMDEALHIVKDLLPKHFCYKAKIFAADGAIVLDYDHFSKYEKKGAEKPKMTGFKIRLKM